LWVTQEASVGFPKISDGVSKYSQKKVEYVRLHVLIAVLVVAIETSAAVGHST
jgi:hypothetical protein